MIRGDRVLLAGIGMLRARLVPRWAAIAVIVSSPLHAVAHAAAIDPLDIVAFALLTVGFGTAGAQMLAVVPAPLVAPALEGGAG